MGEPLIDDARRSLVRDRMCYCFRVAREIRMKKSARLNWFTRIFLLLWGVVIFLMVATDVLEPLRNDDPWTFMTILSIAIIVVSYIAGTIIERWFGDPSA